MEIKKLKIDLQNRSPWNFSFFTEILKFMFHFCSISSSARNPFRWQRLLFASPRGGLRKAFSQDHHFLSPEQALGRVLHTHSKLKLIRPSENWTSCNCCLLWSIWIHIVSIIAGQHLRGKASRQFGYETARSIPWIWWT